MLAATVCVVVVPIVAVWSLPTADDAIDIIASVAVSMLLSVGISELGARAWRRYPLSNDILFSDLLIWGWVRRLRLERRLDRLSREAEVVSAAHTGPISPDHINHLQRLCELLEARDPHTRRHSARVARHAVEIGRRLSISKTDLDRLRTAALLHDIGKLLTPRLVLNKPGRLTEAEFDIVKRHPGQGADILTRARVHPATVAMVRFHHERLSGSGYPEGLAGADIPLGARIIAVADTFDAITSTRPYRPARPHEEAIKVLRQEAGRELDAAAVEAFIDYYSGRTHVGVWGLGSGLAGGLAPVRQFLTQVGSGTAAPVLAASALVATPALTVASEISPQRIERGPLRADTGSRPGMPTPTTAAARAPGSGRVLAQTITGGRNASRPGEAATRARGKRVLLTGPDGRIIASLPGPQPRPAGAGTPTPPAANGSSDPHTGAGHGVLEPPSPPNPAAAPQPPAAVPPPSPPRPTVPDPTPKPQKTPKPQPTPDHTPKPEPTPTPKPRPTPKPEKTPKPIPTPKPEKTPVPQQPPAPQPNPSPGPEKTPKPEKTPEPYPQPVDTPEPEKTPKPDKDTKGPDR